MYRYDPLKWWHVDPVKRQRVKDIAVLICVILAFVSAFVAGSAAKKSSNAAEVAKTLSTCTRGVLGDLLDSQNARATSAADTQVAEDKLDIEQQHFLLAVANPEATTAEQKQAFQDYLAALQVKVEFSKKQTQVRAQNPLPTRADLEDCVEAK